MKKWKRELSLVLVICMLALTLAGCGSKKDDSPAADTGKQETTDDGNTGTDEDTANTPDTGDTGEENPPVDTNADAAIWEALDPSVSGEISIMVWSGDSVYYEDIGKKDWSPEDITTQNVAIVYAMAKKFNETYPNVKINLWAKADDPNGNETSWYQEMENFKAEHGKYPDIYASTDLTGDVSRGLVADLSVFKDDPMYQSFNTALMEMMNYYGFQAGIPQFNQPWGVYVNKELAEQNNIEVPDPEWTIDDYTDFVGAADGKTFWGNANTPFSFIDTGTKDINYNLANYESGDRVNLNSEAVADLLSYIPSWAKTALFAQQAVGNVPQEVMDDGWWWGYRMFCRNYILTYDGDPWMLNAAALEGAESNVVESADWDIYPRPSTAYAENTVGVVLDPMAVHNYAMDDGNPEWSDTEKDQLKLSYTFGSYWCGSTEAMQARADQMYTDNGTLKCALNDTFPLVTGDEFDKQMEIWYSVDTHKRYGDAEKMPGFQKVLEIWEKGQFWDISDKAYLYYVMEDGAQKTCMYEWLNATNAEVAGAASTDGNWLDNVKAKLSDWNTTINGRFVEAENSLKDGLKNYYGFTDADFGN